MFRLFLATPERLVFDDDVLSVNAPGTVGYFEILTNHAPIISTLKPGKLVVKDKNQKKWVWALSGGYLEMSHNHATLLADAVELVSEIDLKRAETALAKAQKRIESKDPNIDIMRAKEALARAENRIKIRLAP